jgi:hypothetical protein
MTQARSESLQPKIIHNLERVAELMFRYVINTNNRDELKRIVTQIRDTYDEPNQSLVWGPLYWALGLRDRTPEIESVLEAASVNVVNFLQELVSLFENEKGDWVKPQSANPTLMYKILANLPDLKKPGFDPRNSIEQSQLPHLRDLFVQKCKIYIEAKIRTQQELASGATVRTKVTRMAAENVRVVADKLNALLTDQYVSKPREDVKVIGSDVQVRGRQALTALFSPVKPKSKVSPPVIELLEGPIDLEEDAPLDDFLNSNVTETIQPTARTIPVGLSLFHEEEGYIPPPPPPPPPVSVIPQSFYKPAIRSGDIHQATELTPPTPSIF